MPRSGARGCGNGRGTEHWNLNGIETPGGSLSPVVVHSQEGQRRVVLIGLEAGQRSTTTR